MKARTALAGAVAGLVSVAVHGAGALQFRTEPVPQLAGGPAQLAMLGNSFEDAAAGVAEPVTDLAEPETTQPPETIDWIASPRRPDSLKTNFAGGDWIWWVNTGQLWS